MTASGVLEPLRSAEFGAGLRFGLLGLVLGAALGLWWRSSHRGPISAAGLAVAMAAAAGLAETGDLPAGLVLGLAMLAAAGVAFDLLAARQWTLPVLAIPGAWLVAARGDLVDVGWIRLLVAGTIVVGGCLVADFDRRWRDAGFAPVLLAVSAAGVYATVPDTEVALVLLAAALALAPLGWPRPLASFGTAGSLAATGMLAWTVAAGGRGRESSIVGGVACLGVFVIEPLARALWGDDQGDGWLGAERAAPWLAIVPVALAHLVLVAVASRVAGLRESLREAILIIEALLALALFLGRLARRRSCRPSRSPGRRSSPSPSPPESHSPPR